MACVRMLRFKRYYKGTVQERLTIFISFCSKFTAVHVCQIRAWFDKVIAKIKWCSFLTHIVSDLMADKTFGVPWICDGLYGPWIIENNPLISISNRKCFRGHKGSTYSYLIVAFLFSL